LNAFVGRSKVAAYHYGSPVHGAVHEATRIPLVLMLMSAVKERMHSARMASSGTRPRQGEAPSQLRHAHCGVAGDLNMSTAAKWPRT